MVNHILLKNPNPIINIPSRHVTTEFVTFMKSTGVGQSYINFVDGSYKRLRERITGIASALAEAKCKTKPCGPRWLFIGQIFGALILGPASIDL
jgi:hypothetical protein